VTINKLLMVQE